MVDGDVWRGQMEARVAALEDRARELADREHVLGENFVALRVDLTAIRTEQVAIHSELRDLTGVVKADAVKREEDREEEQGKTIAEIRAAAERRRLTWVQVLSVLATILGCAIIGPLVVLGITGQL